MNRRSFFGVAAALASVIPLAMVQATNDHGNKITASDPPEPGFTYMGNRRYQVYVDGVLLQRALRFDAEAGLAWYADHDAMRRDRFKVSRFPIERMVRGKIEFVRIA